MAGDRALSGPILGKWPAPGETRHGRVSFRHGDGIIAITSRRARLASTSSLWDTGPDAGQLLLSAHDDEWERSHCFAVARPMPLLPSVMSAIFPSNLPMCFSCLVISLWNTDSVQ